MYISTLYIGIYEIRVCSKRTTNQKYLLIRTALLTYTACVNLRFISILAVYNRKLPFSL